MASSFLQQKAKKQAKELEEEWGPSAYGGTTWLNEQVSGKKKDDDVAPVKKTTTTTTTTKKTTAATTTKNTTSNFLQQIAEAQAEELEEEWGPSAYGGTTWLNEQVSGKNKDDDRKWFDTGAFDDGYQFGDVFKTILGTATDVAENIGAGIVGMGEKALDAIAYVSPLLAKGQFYQNGGEYMSAQTQKMFNESNDAAKKWSADFIKKDLYDEEEIAKKIVLGTDKNSVLGEKSDALIQSGGQLLGTIGLQAAGVPWFLTTGATSFGSQAEVALNDGAGYEEAGLSSVISAGAEILTEKLSGGIKFGGKTLDDALLKPLTEKIANKAVKTLVNLGVDAVGEGTEEVVSGVFSNLGTSIYKKKDIKDLLFSEEAMDEYLESFIGGAVLGGVSSGIGAIRDSKRIHLTENEQKVVEHEYEKRTEGKTLTAKEESKVRNEIVRDMQRGYISTDTIEEVLGGDTYRTWKNTVDSEDALQREYDELGKKQNATLAEQTRYNELHQQLKDLKTTSQSNSLKEQLGSEVMSIVQSERLAESYNERSRRGQAFEADLTKYDEKQRETIQKAIDSGILNNTNRTHEFVDMIAKITADKGVLFDFTNNEKLKESGFAVDGKEVNGFLKGDTITLNMDSAKARNSVVGHEITHVLEGTELYQTLQDTVIEYAKAKGDYQGRYDALAKLYEGVEGADINAELTADLVGDYLFTDTDFVRNLSVQHRNVFQKIYDEIKYLCKVATADSKEARELEKVKKAFEKAYKAGGETQSETKYSLSETTDGRFAAVVDNDILSTIDTSSWDDTKKAAAKKAAVDALKQFNDGIVVDGITRKVNRTSRREYTRSNYTESLYNKAPEVFADKMRAADIADDIVVAATDWSRDGGLKHPRTDDFVDFDHGNTLIVSGDAKYSAEVVVGITKNGEAVFYDVVDLKPAEFEVKKEEAPTTATTQNAIGDIQGTSFGENVTQENPNVKFSLSEPVEETKNLVALHNLTADKLTKSLQLGGMPMPSIAVTKADIEHSNFGDITLIFGRETIDPKVNRKNKAYSADAWTPVFPRVEYEADSKVSNRISQKLRSLEGSIDDTFQRDLQRLQYGYEDYLNRDGGEEGLIRRVMDNYGLKAAYLEEQGKHIDKVTKQEEAKKPYNPDNADKYQKIMGILGVATPEEIGKVNLKDARDQHGAELEAVYPGVTKDAFRMGRIFGAVKSYLESKDSPPVYNTVTDVGATKSAVDEALDAEGYEAWVRDLFSGIVKDSGIYNNKDIYTPSGNRRSFKQTHLPVTLENIVKAMAGQNNGKTKNVSGFNGIKTLRAATAETFKSVDQMHQREDRLQNLTEEQVEALHNELQDRLYKLIETIDNEGGKSGESNPYIRFDSIGETLTEIGESGKFGVADIQRVFQQYSKTISDDTALEVKQLLYDVAQMPVNLFEAKPERVVGFDEAKVFVIPNNADVKLKQELLNRGYSIAEYDPNIEGHRQQVVNQFEEYKFSLSNVGEEANADSLSALKLETAPVQETVAENATVEENLFPDDAYAPIADDPARFDSLDDRDMPPEREAPYSEEQTEYVDDPFEDRDFYEVGKRNVKAYMYENPEVKPFFQEEALMLGSELADTIKAERWYNDELYSQTGGQKGFGGNKRLTSDSIATLLDDWGMSYADIEKGINAIVEDHGAENIAAAKKIEFMLNDRLMNGYKNFYEHGYVEPNAAYLDLLYEKQINEYSKEAFDAFMANADQYAPPVVEDIAPVAKPKQSVAMNAPVAAKYEAIRPKKQTEPRMAKATPAEMAAYHGQQTMKGFEPKTAKVLTDEPKVDPKKPKAWTLFKDNLVDKGTVFETMSLKTGNRELQGKWKAIGRAESSAQWFMEHGNAEASSLKSIRETVEKSGKTQKFYEYLYHMHNIDRMSLVERNLDIEDKPVFGYGMTSDMSKAEAANLEKANPEFKRWAKDVYSYNQAQREMMVEGGLISRETADHWEQKYPHYVPVRRVGDEGLNINVALDTKKTGVNAPIKKATGGNRNILPLFDTMALRTEQTFKAIAKNRFGVELKNMLGTTIDTGTVSVDEMIDSVDMQDGLLQEGKGGNNPTFTVFENGERVTFEITEEMYDTMKPKGKFASYTNKVLNTMNNVRRGLLTEYNPAFMLTNPIKDTQDVMINSQHPARTYANYPKAAAELWTKGQYYQEYMEHGGEMNTYFDGETKTFAKEKSGLSKVIGFPLEAISTVNNFIERVPRMAEYIASRKMGRSIDVSMLDAARVTTDFSAGGDFVKTLNRNGFTFLNASVQGAAQQVRNVREAKAEGLKGWAKLATKIAVAGLPSILLNNLLWDDDEEYAELSDYVKQNYYVVAKYGDGKFVRIPKGRALAVIQNGFEQMQNLITGNDEIDFDVFAELVISNLAPSNPLENNLIAPIIQAKNNETWYGDDLVPSRLQDLPAAEQYDETTDSLSKWLGEKLNVSPYKINYLLDQYSGGIGDVFLPMMTPEAERGNDSKWADLIAPISDKFTTDSVLKNQNVTDFYSKRDELEVVSNGRNATKEDMLKKVFVDAVSWEMSDLYAEKREIQNSDMPDAEKYEAVREIQKKINALAESGLNGYEAVYSDGAYAEVGDRRFNYYKDKDTWYEIKEKNADGSDNWYYTQEQLFRDKLGVSYADYWNDKFDPAKNHVKTHYGEMNGKRYNYSEENNMWYEIKQKNDDGTDNWYYQKEQEVTKGLGISYTKYWNNREEYNFAYDHPQTYALAKAVGGYKTYMPYYDALENWQSDTYIASDKDENGDTIYNSRKKKVQAYLNDLDIPEMDKLLLYKSVYNSYDDRNYEIIDYLNKSDLTFEETVNALRGLGFDVTDDGAISWK